MPAITTNNPSFSLSFAWPPGNIAVTLSRMQQNRVMQDTNQSVAKSHRPRPHRPKVKGCFECSQRRVNCDRGTPVCQKCLSKGLKCSGLGVRLRFNHGIAARGKWVGKTAQAMHKELERSPPKPVSGPVTLCFEHTPLTKVPDGIDSCDRNAGSFPTEHNHGVAIVARASQMESLATDCSEHVLDAETPGSAESPDALKLQAPSEAETWLAPLFDGDNHIVAWRSSASAPQQPISDNIHLWKKILLLNFSENIAGEMMAIDGKHNGWRHIVLPIAHHDELLMHAVLAVSAFHLHNRGIGQKFLPRSFFSKPQERARCDELYGLAIRSLQQRRELNAMDGENWHLVLLAILVLLVAVMVTGSQDFPILFHMLESALEAGGGPEQLGKSDLAAFVLRQIHKLRVYAAPFLSEENGFRTLSSQKNMDRFFNCLNHCCEQQPNAANAAPIIRSLVQQAHEIYLLQALSARATSTASVMPCTVPTPSFDSVLRVQRFKETLESFPQECPGQQVLIWATFIAASDCILDEHKAFFDDILLRYYVRSGFVNLLSGRDHLRKIWAQRRPGISWTSLLSQSKVFIM